jgi:competence protein ComFC
MANSFVSLYAARIRLLAQHLQNTALDFFFPPRCIACGCAGSLFCSECQAALPSPPPVVEPGSLLVERRATAEFGGAVQKAIHALKYKGQRAYAEPLGQRLAAELARSTWQPTLITAIPLHESRLRTRGYNQSALLAQALSRQVGLPFEPAAIRRLRDTPPQVGLDARERQANVSGAFGAEKRMVRDQHVVIVDDVCTTGATLRECARALLEAGATQVWGLTVASTPSREVSL